MCQWCHLNPNPKSSKIKNKRTENKKWEKKIVRVHHLELWHCSYTWAWVVISVDIWLFQLIVYAFSLETKVEKLIESLRKGTFLEKSLSVVIIT